MAHHNPVLLNDHDGLRLLAKTTFREEQILTFHNPELIAHVAAVKRERVAIREANFHQFG